MPAKHNTRYNSKKRRTKPSPTPFIILIILVAFGGFGVFLYLENRTYTVTINGTPHELKGEHSLESLVADEFANPEPGDMIAIDGSIFEVAGGNEFEASVNGIEEKNHQRTVKDGDVIDIRDGIDLNEPVEDRTEAVPFEVVEQGGGPIHIYQGEGVDGSRLVKKGSLSGIELFEEITAPQHMTLLKYYANTNGEKVIALTLDDGPWKDTTAQILDVLAEHQVKATFFAVGELIDRDDAGKQLVKRAFDEGHQICTHTFGHARGSGQSVDISLMTSEEQINEILRGYESIEAVTGTEVSRVFRAPGGNFKSNSQKILAPYVYAEIGWTIDTTDWGQPGVDAIVNQITSVSSGGIILMHDGGGDRTQTVEALKKAIPILKDKGYRFVTIDELLQYPPL